MLFATSKIVLISPKKVKSFSLIHSAIVIFPVPYYVFFHLADFSQIASRRPEGY